MSKWSSLFFASLLLGLTQRDVAAQATESLKLYGSVRETSGYFGGSVAADGNRLVVGAPGEGEYAGAAYVFERDGSGMWIEVARVQSADLEVGDWFGLSVSVSGDRLIVGAFREDSGGEDAGAAYVFERAGTGIWAEVAKLQASFRIAGRNFGANVSISGDYAVIGSVGASYVFERDAGDVWQQKAILQKFTSPSFGWRAAINGDRIIVAEEGSAYIFERDVAGMWMEVARLEGQTPWFGIYSVAVSGDHVIIAEKEEAAHLFARQEGGSWTETGFSGPPTRCSDSDEVAIDGRRAAVVGRCLPSPIEFVDYLYLLERDETNQWAEVARFTRSDKDDSGWPSGHIGGHGIAVTEDYIAVGLCWESSFATHNGAVYVFETIGVGVDDPQVAEVFSLSRNYPNPFNPSTTISYDLPQAADVTLTVYDVLGRQVRELASGRQPAGTYEVSFDATRLPSGIYFYRLAAGDFVETKRMVVVR